MVRGVGRRRSGRFKKKCLLACDSERKKKWQKNFNVSSWILQRIMFCNVSLNFVLLCILDFRYLHFVATHSELLLLPFICIARFRVLKCCALPFWFSLDCAQASRLGLRSRLLVHCIRVIPSCVLAYFPFVAGNDLCVWFCSFCSSCTFFFTVAW